MDRWGWLCPPIQQITRRLRLRKCIAWNAARLRAAAQPAVSLLASASSLVL